MINTQYSMEQLERIQSEYSSRKANLLNGILDLYTFYKHTGIRNIKDELRFRIYELRFVDLLTSLRLVKEFSFLYNKL